MMRSLNSTRLIGGLARGLVMLALVLMAIPAWATPGFLDDEADIFFNGEIEEGKHLPEGSRILLVRSYLPPGGDYRSVQLPRLTVVREDGNGNVTRQPLVTCPWREQFGEPDHRKSQRMVAKGKPMIDVFRQLYVEEDIEDFRAVGFPYCSHWTMTSSESFNIAFPDSRAFYWATPFYFDPKHPERTKVVINGKWNDERYMSLALYDETVNFYTDPKTGQASFLADYEIDPKPGSTNPYRDYVSSSDIPDQKYRVKIRYPLKTFKDGTPKPNQMPWVGDPPQDQLGSPNDLGDLRPHNRWPLPKECGTGATAEIREGELQCSPENVFVLPPTRDQGSIFSNRDNWYGPAIARLGKLTEEDAKLDDGVVLVITGQLPRTPPGTGAWPWDPDSTEYDLRYFSLCAAVYQQPYPALEGYGSGCVYDNELNVQMRPPLDDPDGEPVPWYTIVASTADDKPVEGIAMDMANGEGVNWIEAPDGGLTAPRRNPQRTLFIVRDMMPTTHFLASGGAFQSQNRTGNFVDFLTGLGDFAPRISVICHKEHYNKYGWGGCVSPATRFAE